MPVAALAEQIGKVETDGRVYSGTGGLFGSKEHLGIVEAPHLFGSGAALLLLIL